MPELIDVILPESDEETADAVVAQWLKKAGERVKLHEPLLEVNTDKVVLEVPSPAGGVLRNVLKKEGDSISPGEALGQIEPVADGPPPAASISAGPEPTKRGQPGPRLSPAVRRLLKEHSFDPSRIQGTGRGGRITHQDALQAVRAAKGPSLAPVAETRTGSSRRVPHSPMRRSVAAHMLESARTAPHVTSVFEADFSAVARDRAARKDDFQRQGAPLTYTAYLVAAAARALVEVPEVNSRWHDNELEIFDDCDIGVAVALGRGGLLVPVIRRAQDLSLLGIAARLHELTGMARANRLRNEHLEGGTFTITNHGVSGSLIATPLIHQPQSAILGVGKVQKRLTVSGPDGDETIKIKPMAYVTLTIDHRALDGFTANLFLSSFVEALQGWS